MTVNSTPSSPFNMTNFLSHCTVFTIAVQIMNQLQRFSARSHDHHVLFRTVSKQSMKWSRGNLHRKYITLIREMQRNSLLLTYAPLKQHFIGEKLSNFPWFQINGIFVIHDKMLLKLMIIIISKILLGKYFVVEFTYSVFNNNCVSELSKPPCLYIFYDIYILIEHESTK